jgi:hypothetical protein
VGLNPPKDLKPRHLVGVFYVNFVISKVFRIFTIMKKYILIMAFIAVTALTACGSGSTATETNDSTAAPVDSTSVGVTSPTTAEIPADSTAKEVK